MSAKLVAVMLARLASPVASFAVLVLLARQWGGVSLGEYSVAWAWLAMFQHVSMLGVSEYISRELGYHRNQAPESLTNGFLFVTLSSVVCAFAMSGCGAMIDAPAGVRSAILTASVALPFTAYGAFCQAVFTALHKIRLLALAGITENMIFVALASAVILHKGGVARLFCALIFARALGAVFATFLLVTRIARPECRPKWAVFRRTLSTVSVFGITGAAFQVYTRADVLIMARFKDMAAVGLYSSASKLLELCTMLPLTFYLLNLSVAANAYRSRKDTATAEMQRLSWPFFIAVLFVFGVGTLFAGSILRHLYGGAFGQAATVLRVLLCVFALHSVQLMLEMCCQAAGYQKLAMYIALARAAACIGLNVILIPAFGAIGAALALLVSTMISLAAFCRAASRKLEGMSLKGLMWPRRGVSGAVATQRWFGTA